MEDWRLKNGGEYLKGLSWSWKAYKAYRDNWDHDHCELCMAKFTEGSENNANDLAEGYSANNNYRWICEGCFNDFKDLYRWNKEPSAEV